MWEKKSNTSQDIDLSCGVRKSIWYFPKVMQNLQRSVNKNLWVQSFKVSRVAVMPNDEIMPDWAVPLEFGQSQRIRIDTEFGFKVLVISNDGGQYSFAWSEKVSDAGILPSLEEGGIFRVGTGGTEIFNKRFFQIVDGEPNPIPSTIKKTRFQRLTSVFKSSDKMEHLGIGITGSAFGGFAYELASLLAKS